MDQDSENRVLAAGRYRSAKNARTGSSQVSNVGAIESMPSNVLLSGYTFPSGTNKCIGTCQDVKNTAIIYCFYNSNGNHRIIRWYANSNTFENILPTAWTVSVLGWTANTRLWNIRIVETGTNQLMFFHDVQGIPRRISLNIPQQPTINPRGTGAYTLSEDDISVIRKPPFKEPTLAYLVDSAYSSNLIKNVFFQFRYRYIYENDEISSWSSFSEISIPPQDGVDYNKIRVTFNSGVKGVVKVELARRIGNGVTQTGTTNPELYIFKTWEKKLNSDNTNYNEDFFNTEVLTPVSLNQSSKVFDQVPLLVGCQEVVQSNQVIYGDVTEGYDNITNGNVAINLTYDRTGIGEFTYTPNGSNNYQFFVGDWELPSVGDFIIVQIGETSFWVEVSVATQADIGAALVILLNVNGINATYSAGTVTTSANFDDNFIRAYWVPQLIFKESELVLWNKTNASQNMTGGYTKIEFNAIQLNGVNKLNLTDFEFYDDVNDCLLQIDISVLCNFSGSATYNAVLLDVDTNAPIYYKQSSALAGTTSPVVLNVNINGTALMGKKIAFAIEKLSGTNFSTTGSTHSFEISIKRYNSNLAQGFKSGAEHSFGIVYFDQYKRQGGVQAITKQYIDFPTQRAYREYFNTVFDDTQGYIPQLDWEIKHLPPSWAYYYSWVYNGSTIKNYAQIIAYVSTPETDVTSTYINLNPKNLFDFGFIYNGFSAGDRIRILTNPGIFWNDKDNPYPLSTVRDRYIEGYILGFSTEAIKVQLNNSEINLSTLDQCLVEIFAVDNSEFFFEQNILEIGNPTASNRFHKGPNQNQDPNNPVTTPAKGNFVGNCYFKFAANYTDSNSVYWYLTESNSITYAVESNYWDKGRPQIETPDQKQLRIKWMYRWGNQLLQDTQVNGMSSFDSGNYGLLSARFGALTGLREVGYTLKMIQELNYNMAFIGRRQLQNADGSTQLVVTDSLIGSVNPSEEMFGCKHPGSILNNGRSVYWVDVINGMVVRESGNGAFPISSYGMSRYWITACKSIQDNSLEVFCGFDNQTESLFITRKKASSLVSADDVHVTISFYDPDDTNEEKGWVSEHSFDKNVSSTFYGVDMYGSVGSVFTSCLLSGIYRHNESTFLNLYGESKSFKVKSVFNPEADLIKIFLSHWVKMNRSLDGAIFTVPASQQNPNGMRTLLKPGNYAIKEAAYYADLKNDGYTKGLYADNNSIFIQQLVSGRPMREQVLECEITASGSSIFVLFDHEISYILSQWT
jgi:hypothetical protein